MDECCICDSPEVVYVDAVDAGWCREHYHSIFLGEPVMSRD